MESLDQSLLVACSATVMLTLGLGNSSLYTERGEGHAAHITPDYTTLVTSDRLSTLSVEREGPVIHDLALSLYFALL